MAKDSKTGVVGSTISMIFFFEIEGMHTRKDDKVIGVEEPLNSLFIRLVRVIVDKNALTVYVPSNEAQVEYKVQPYARKEDGTAMKAVTPVQILHGNISTPPACNFSYNIPAMIFSSGGFTGNLFHEFNEIIIPLFIMSRRFRSQLQFVITDFKPWWVSKYERILSSLSRYSMFDFKQFLRESYMLKMQDVSNQMGEKPVLVLISRRKTRKFLNEDKMVIAATPNQTSNLDTFSGLVNSCSVMVGAHGAGLTNALFLPAGALTIMVDRRVKWEESSLIDDYGPDHPVITDPMSISLKGYRAFRAVYVDGQNLKVNMVRFRETLAEALKLVGGSTPSN
ncbi:protein O-linked-mannose beta-1,4-N-acetylglucosaminyltransferase 2-like [Pyrus ussuriensis x Pyrus communis]|uniref:Protein O-linked-mannose beta-1,4-N-acetylglucosaminyltransferase 2-like n=1 Tax=Pyrus ussuriensis x Pyrus communis TaxID=2448454 RepID=A0A5N5GJA5_9ROSA|nr:protein O-linked-mannose beta-1,4-N-acetylglucosaminyltransferase 2-like [Pyrus ussuriensis x Pyrus communis]